MLLPNVLAKSAAHDAGAAEAILHRDGVVTEGSSTSVFAVRNGELWTHPADDLILGGITRALILRVARQQNVPCVEQPFTTADLLAADEVFITGTTTHVAAVVQIDRTPISPTGTTAPGTTAGPERGPDAGPITRQLYDGLIEMILAATA
jgi:D-alanine transaminase